MNKQKLSCSNDGVIQIKRKTWIVQRNEKNDHIFKTNEKKLTIKTFDRS